MVKPKKSPKYKWDIFVTKEEENKYEKYYPKKLGRPKNVRKR